ncbi:hypothetical protein [Bacillus ndiopicus]|uniref:hypothetical protein n=1 Tax=Bacillus ndiopicus TaxID=1347368 RepID=UPI0005AB1C3B|nr:hypothetical protein [Bacillus ndiopicus]
MKFFTWGIIGAVILGVATSLKKGNFQQFTKNMPNKLNSQNAQQMAQPLQAVANSLSENIVKQ